MYVDAAAIRSSLLGWQIVSPCGDVDLALVAFFTQPWEIHFIIQQGFLSTWLIFATHCCCTTFKIKKKNKHQPVCQAMCLWHWPPVAFGVLCHCRSALQFNHSLIVFCWLHSKAVFLLLVTVAYFSHLSTWATMGFLLVCFGFTAS